MSKGPHKKKKTEFIGLGCLIQGLSLLGIYVGMLIGGSVAAFVSIEAGLALGVTVGALIVIPLFIYGSAMSVKWICSECRNPLFNKKVKMCPVCKSEFDSK